MIIFPFPIWHSPGRIIAALFVGHLMAAFWPHRMKKGEKGGQNPAIDVFWNFPEPLQTAHFKGVI